MGWDIRVDIFTRESIDQTWRMGLWLVAGDEVHDLWSSHRNMGDILLKNVALAFSALTT